MLSRTTAAVLRRSASLTARRSMSEAAGAPSSSVTLNFNLPHETLYDGAQVYSVIVPGVEGEYGVTANHVPYVGQLKPGVLQILHEENTSEPEKYFVAGGYALTHENSVTVSHHFGNPQIIITVSDHQIQDVVCPEAVKLEDIDSSAVSAQYDAAKSAFASAEAGTVEQAEAQIEMEVNRAMGQAIGVTLG